MAEEAAVTTDELLESLDRHFLAGCPELSTSQLRDHERTGTCPECRGRASGSVPAVAAQES